MNARQVASYIDHTMLDPTQTRAKLKKLCSEAVQYGFKSVCVLPGSVATCGDFLHGTSVRVSCEIFIYDMRRIDTYVCIAEEAIRDGASEIGIFIFLTDIEEMQQAVETIRAFCPIVAMIKVHVVEECLLTERIKRMIRAAALTGADYVAMSYSFIYNLQEICRMVGPKIGIKFEGELPRFCDAVTLINMGATRIGCSTGVRIMQSAPS